MAADDLQFQRAEYSGPSAGSTCVLCKRPIEQSYYEVNGRVMCEPCQGRLQAHQSGGSGAARFVRALLFGGGAALLGAIIHFAIAALTGYEFGLIAVLVGFMVGYAVRAGAQGRGGWVYQTLAVLLTYTAIVTTYIPTIFKDMKAYATSSGQTATSSATPSNPSSDAAASSPRKAPHPLKMLIAFAFLFAIACAVPFLAGIKNILGLIIIGFGLYQAWKLNKRMRFQISGPFSLATRPPPAAGVA